MCVYRYTDINIDVYAHIYMLVYICILVHGCVCMSVCVYTYTPTKCSQIIPKVGREQEHKTYPLCFPCPEVCNLLKTLPKTAISRRTEEQRHLFYKNCTENVFTKVLSQEDIQNILSR